MIFLLLLTAACLIPFLPTPFHLDDTYWVQMAAQIRQHPLDPFGYQFNWYGHDVLLAKIVQAPPGFSYVLAAWSVVMGTSEVGAHVMNLLLALACVAGIYKLAQKFQCDPFTVTLISIASPVFLMPATTVMSDTLMLTLLVWSLLIWIIADEQNSPRWFLISVVLLSASMVTKYNGAIGLGLIFLWSVQRRRGLDKTLLWLLVPCASLTLYSLAVGALYNKPFLSTTARFVEESRTTSPTSMTTGLVFVGALALGIPFLVRALHRFEWLVLLAGTVLIELLSSPGKNPSLWWTTQHAFWLWCGLALMWLCLREMVRRRDGLSVLLFAWFGVTFVFAVLMNWSVTGRSLITLTPAVGLLLARAQHAMPSLSKRSSLLYSLPALALTLLVIGADKAMAQRAHDSALDITGHFNQQHLAGRTLWFEGHWGFQYYMQQRGGRTIDFSDSELKVSDILAVPMTNANVYVPADEDAQFIGTITKPARLPLTTMNASVSAGYHSSLWGRLPYVWGPAIADDVYLYSIRKAQRGLHHH